MTGRPSNSYNLGLQVLVDLPIFLVKYQPIIPKKARKTYFDGKRLFRLSETTMTHGIKVYEKDFDKVKENLTKLGYKKIRAEQMTTTFPLYCPKCGKPDGHPILRLENKLLSASDENFKEKKTRYQIFYNHSKPKYHQCFVGYWSPKGVQHAKEIDVKKLSPFYVLPEKGSMYFDIPKKRKKPGKTLS